MIKFMPSLLTVLFVGLKLTGHIDWSWLWVLSPIWITLSIVVFLFVLAFIFLGKDEFIRSIKQR